MNKQIIKWSGSKRSQAERICDRIPNSSFKTYYEPFCGSSSVLIELLNRDDKYKFNNFICSDSNEDLINLWIFHFDGFLFEWIISLIILIVFLYYNIILLYIFIYFNYILYILLYLLLSN